MEKDDFNPCCIKEIKRIYEQEGTPTFYLFNHHCPKCGHYIGITPNKWVPDPDGFWFGKPVLETWEDVNRFLVEHGETPIEI